jgi:hypothetical protein
MANSLRALASWFPVAAAIAVLACTACDPLSSTTLRVAPRAPSADESVSVAALADADVDAVVAIAGEVSAAHALERLDPRGEPNVVAAFGHDWGFAGDGHAPSTGVAVEHDARRPKFVDVKVTEFPAFRHSALARTVIDELKARLRERFGDDAVTSSR